MKIRPELLLAASLAAAIPWTASAGPALGGSIGSARVNHGDFEGSESSWKVFAGTSFTEVIGGEIGYINFGRLGGNGPDARSFNLGVLVSLPLGGITPYGKAGVAFADIEGSSLRQEYKDEDPFFGVGLRFAPRASPLAFRLEYERFRLEQENLDMASAGLEFRF